MSGSLEIGSSVLISAVRYRTVEQSDTFPTRWFSYVRIVQYQIILEYGVVRRSSRAPPSLAVHSDRFGWARRPRPIQAAVEKDIRVMAKHICNRWR
jgi:hypothetical protein